MFDVTRSRRDGTFSDHSRRAAGRWRLDGVRRQSSPEARSSMTGVGLQNYLVSKRVYRLQAELRLDPSQ